MKSLALLLIPFLSSCVQHSQNPMLEPENTLGYYEILRQKCTPNAMEYTGCIQSVDFMKSHEYRQAEGGRCPTGMNSNSFDTIGALVWCESEQDTGTGSQSLQTQNTGGTMKDFGNGFILSQTDDETTLSYSGEVIKTWSHTPPEKVPFIWDEGCEEFTQKVASLSRIETSENTSVLKQQFWESLGIDKQKQCMKEYFWKNTIDVEEVTEGFFKIYRHSYETFDLWVYDTKGGNLQNIPAMGEVKIQKTNTGITITIENSHGDIRETEFRYDTNFEKLISRVDIP